MGQLKPAMKKMISALAFVTVLPLILGSRFLSACGSDEFFTSAACFLALFPGKTGSYLRVAYYRGTLAAMSSDVYMAFGSFFSRRGAVIGKNVSIGAYCILGDVTLKDRVLLASHVSITSGKRQHALRFDADNPSEETIFDHVTIGCECWIGEGAIIMADVGDRSIVSAGSVVTRDMPANRIIAGNPARVLQEVSAQTTLKPD